MASAIVLTPRDRMGFIARVVDGFEYPESLEDIFLLWIEAEFFKQLIQKGYCMVSYNGNPPVAFEPKVEKQNRHQAIALSLFVSSVYFQKGKEVKISVPHEIEGNFEAIFKKVDANCVEYTNDFGSKVKFTFDPFKASQFIALKAIYW